MAQLERLIEVHFSPVRQGGGKPRPSPLRPLELLGRRVGATARVALPLKLTPMGRPMTALRAILLFLGLALLLSACAPDTGIFGGGTWQLTGLQHQHIRALAIDPKDPQKIYAGDTQDGIFFSSDAGAHWTPRNTGLPLPDAIQAISFDDSEKLYTATQKGLFVSTDGGQQWQIVNTASSHLPSDSYTSLAFDANTPEAAYVGTARHGVWISIDYGRTWSQASNGLPADIAISSLLFDSVQRQLWATTPVGVYLSQDQGTSWHTLTTGLPPQTVVYTVAPATASGGPQGLIYAGTNHGVFQSQDDGAHWTTNSQSLSAVLIYTLLVDFRSTNATTIYAGTSLGAFRSDNSGQSWSEIATGLPKGAPVYALTLGATNYSQLYAASDAVYLFPGNSGGLTPARLLPWLFVLLLFFLLYRITARGRKRTPKDRRGPGKE
jgi:photosystem II stability/assembly factor-like uncharacterized protein